MPPKNFSSGLLAKAPDQIAVVELQNVLWNDWGRPEQILNSLERIGRTPAFHLDHLVAC